MRKLGIVVSLLNKIASCVLVLILIAVFMFEGFMIEGLYDFMYELNDLSWYNVFKAMELKDNVIRIIDIAQISMVIVVTIDMAAYVFMFIRAKMSKSLKV